MSNLSAVQLDNIAEDMLITLLGQGVQADFVADENDEKDLGLDSFTTLTVNRLIEQKLEAIREAIQEGRLKV